jgi:hypothetical protein
MFFGKNIAFTTTEKIQSPKHGTGRKEKQSMSLTLFKVIQTHSKRVEEFLERIALAQERIDARLAPAPKVEEMQIVEITPVQDPMSEADKLAEQLDEDMLGLHPQEEMVIAEKRELDGKLNKLKAFIESNPVFKSLSASDRDLINRQYDAMVEYSIILTQRIDRFEVVPG